eukprot:augustus_masked-scaffold_3-processed-gene-2.52-mRNA-1 protein AED:0.03 eAED:0.03 QI:0/-1/0/1/-1/1/1/0/546
MGKKDQQKFVSEQQSRYKSSNNVFQDQLSAEAVQKLCQEVRSTFNSGASTSLEFRISQLKALKNFLIKEKKEISQALYEDLHKSEFDSYITEIQPTIGEIDLAIQELPHWIKPTPKGQTAVVAHSWNYTVPDPLGRCLILGSWNYPVFLLLGPLVGAIAGGNCVVLKPGSYAKATSNVIVRLLPNYLDKKCFKVLEGNRQVTSALLEEKWDKIFFTGSGFVGKKVALAAAKHLTPVVLELGGKSPAIVGKSSMIDLAAERISWGAFLNGGQTCVRPDFVLVHEEVGDKLIQNMVKHIKTMFGNDAQGSSNLGRMINKGAFDRLQGLIEEHKDKVVYGGKTVETSEQGNFYVEPTILDFGSDLKSFAEAKVMQDEIFGPIVPLCRFRSIDQVLEFVKELRTGKPLALYAFSQDQAVIETLKRQTTSGGMCVNDVLVHLVNHHLPFGGVGNSGLGSYHGEYSFKCFTHEKACLVKSQVLDTLPGVKNLLAVRYPPYTDTARKIINSMGNPLLNKVLEIPDALKAKKVALYFAFFYIVLRLLKLKIVAA